MRYAYANSNPYRFTDPDGRMACTADKDSCAQLDRAVTDVKAAAAKLPSGSAEQRRLQTISQRLGQVGEKTGVTVRVIDGSRPGGTKTGFFGKTTIEISLKEIARFSGGAGTDRFRNELAGIMAHEGDHAVTQKENGMPRNREQELSAEKSAYESQGQTHRGLEYGTSNYQLWTPLGGINQRQVNVLAEKSTQDWEGQ